jgi:hypothetical protein
MAHLYGWRFRWEVLAVMREGNTRVHVASCARDLGEGINYCFIPPAYRTTHDKTVHYDVIKRGGSFSGKQKVTV